MKMHVEHTFIDWSTYNDCMFIDWFVQPYLFPQLRQNKPHIQRSIAKFFNRDIYEWN